MTLRYSKISENTIMRFSLYARYLEHLEQAEVSMVSSEQLALAAGVHASNVRKDLQFLGVLGIRSLGYEVIALKNKLQLALGLEQELRLAIWGFGYLGKALFDYCHHHASNFKIVHIFDSRSYVIGERIKGITVKSIKNWEKNLETEPVDIVVIAENIEDPQTMGQSFSTVGVKAVLNFSANRLPLSDATAYKHIDLTGGLNYLRFRILNGYS